MSIETERAFHIAKRVMDTEIEALHCLSKNFDHIFIQIIESICACKGKVIITGMGKSGHVARKMAATMSSLGTSAFFLHPGEAMHGDLGMIQEQDLVVAISYSGESDEIIRIIPNIKVIGAKLIGFTCNANSTLAKKCDIVQSFMDVNEACHLGLAPTTSTTVVMVYGDVLSVTLSQLKGFGKSDFGIYHPAGSLGKKLTIRATDLMKNMQRENILTETSFISDAIVEFGKIGTEILPVNSQNGTFLGIVTNGDIERVIQSQSNIYINCIGDMLNRFPTYIDSDAMAIDALRIMMDHNIHAAPVVNNEKVIGILARQRILDVGIYL